MDLVLKVSNNYGLQVDGPTPSDTCEESRYEYYVFYMV